MSERELPAAFGLQSCRDLYNKLSRELERIRVTDDRRCLEDHGFNFAVTAWHLCDWVWHDMKGNHSLRAELAKEADVSPQKFGLDEFKILLCEKLCRELDYCRIIATASKHVGVDKDNLTVSAAVSATSSNKVSLASVPGGQDPLEMLSRGWALKIAVDDERVRAEEVFERAFRFWREFIYGNQIG